MFLQVEGYALVREGDGVAADFVDVHPFVDVAVEGLRDTEEAVAEGLGSPGELQIMAVQTFPGGVPDVLENRGAGFFVRTQVQLRVSQDPAVDEKPSGPGGVLLEGLGGLVEVREFVHYFAGGFGLLVFAGDDVGGGDVGVPDSHGWGNNVPLVGEGGLELGNCRPVWNHVVCPDPEPLPLRVGEHRGGSHVVGYTGRGGLVDNDDFVLEGVGKVEGKTVQVLDEGDVFVPDVAGTGEEGIADGGFGANKLV